MKIFDCFMFCDEDLLLDLRLNILNQHIDFFVIVESKYFHNGKERQLKFDIKKYKQFENKIIYIVHANEPSWPSPRVCWSESSWFADCC